MKNSENIDLRAMVERELKASKFDGLYSPCGRCENGCPLSDLFSCGSPGKDCQGGKQNPKAQTASIVSSATAEKIEKQIVLEQKHLKEEEKAEQKRLEVERKKKAAEEKRIADEAKKTERLVAKQLKQEEARKRKEIRIAKRKAAIDKLRMKLAKVGEALSGAVRTSILCKLLAGVSIGSVLFSLVSIIAFEVIKYKWLETVAKAEALAALYLFQKLFMFESIYVFVIVSLTVMLVAIRAISGSWKDDETDQEADEKEDEEERFFS